MTYFQPKSFFGAFIMFTTSVTLLLFALEMLEDLSGVCAALSWKKNERPTEATDRATIDQARRLQLVHISFVAGQGTACRDPTTDQPHRQHNRPDGIYGLLDKPLF